MVGKYGWSSIGVMLFYSYVLCLMPHYILVVATLANGWQLHISEDVIMTRVILLGRCFVVVLMLLQSYAAVNIIIKSNCVLSSKVPVVVVVVVVVYLTTNQRHMGYLSSGNGHLAGRYSTP